MCNINISAPNLLVVCIDNTDMGKISGKFYHCYGEKPVIFENVVELLMKAEKFFDGIAFPQASTKTRSFYNHDTQSDSYNKPRPEKVVDQKELLQYHGEKATFAVWVKYRQKSEWQGEAVWREKNIKRYFDNILDLVNEIDKTLQKKIKSEKL